MWTAGRLSRTNSVQSTPRSVASNRSSGFEDGSVNQKIAMWSTSQREAQQLGDSPSRLSRTASTHSMASVSSSRASSVAGEPIDTSAPGARFDWTQSPVEIKLPPTALPQRPAADWTQSPVEIKIPASMAVPARRESISSRTTLAEEPAEHEMDLKTPRAVLKVVEPLVHEIRVADSEATTLAEEPTEPAGPLEAQLLAILSKVRLAEKSKPTVMAEDYKELQDRVKALEAEKTTWQKRHEALYALRDEDLANLIKVRGMLAKERREHDGLKKLRDEDLKNVLELRGKLAHLTWSRSRGSSTATAAIVGEPASAVAARAGSKRSSMREGSNLWEAAKTAALEHRLLEMENANAELKRQLEDANQKLQKQQQQPQQQQQGLRVQTSSAATTHPASMGAGSGVAAGMPKVELLLEETVRHRERASVRVQQLRTENETLRKEVGRLEDRNSELEDTVHRLQKWA